MRRWWLGCVLAPSIMVGACDSFSSPDSKAPADTGVDSGANETSTANDGGTPDAQAPGQTQLALGSEHSCVLLASGSVRCWGNFARLGVAARKLPPQNFRPESVSFANDAGPEPRIVQIAAGVMHTCAVSAAAELFCWGENTAGQLTGALASHEQVPVRIAVPGGFIGWKRVAAGSFHTCAVASRASGEARPFCWGRNSNAESNPAIIPPASVQTAPAEITSAPGDIVEVTAGDSFSCAVNRAGRAFCWGTPYQGRLGDGRTTGERGTVDVLGPKGQPLEGVSRIWAGGSSACAQTSSGTAYCWGLLAAGFGGTDDLPKALGKGDSLRSMSFSVINDRGAFVDAKGAAFRWGTVYLGLASDSQPVALDGLPAGQGPYAWGLGPEHMCLAMRLAPGEDGTFHCLGSNGSRQLGSSVQNADTAQLVQVFDLVDPPAP